MSKTLSSANERRNHADAPGAGTTADAALWRAWAEAVRRPTVEGELRRLYADLDAAVTTRGPTCWASGRCCRFDEYGHRLYVTGLEVAWFLARAESPNSTTQGGNGAGHGGTHHSDHRGLARLAVLPARQADDGSALHQTGCPYQIDGLCSVHAIRPLGCRIFFCQRGTESWQQDLYEAFLGRLRRVHEAHGLGYRYMEWRAGLAEARQARENDGRGAVVW